jgi:hypothetical protein
MDFSGLAHRSAKGASVDQYWHHRQYAEGADRGRQAIF